MEPQAAWVKKYCPESYEDFPDFEFAWDWDTEDFENGGYKYKLIILPYSVSNKTSVGVHELPPEVQKRIFKLGNIFNISMSQYVHYTLIAQLLEDDEEKTQEEE